MEFKHERCPQDASDETKRKLFEAALKDGMEQINTRGYHKKYAGSGKAVYRVAFAFLGRDDIEMRVEQ
ncbi:MAG: PD-(D/E)XK nuclease domain-containing protein [Oscillospiraceae bacterium]|nr:PD-(D/E)XK nuclease domain-containing protein [Oscillospiraceae bacterium]